MSDETTAVVTEAPAVPAPGPAAEVVAEPTVTENGVPLSRGEARRQMLVERSKAKSQASTTPAPTEEPVVAKQDALGRLHDPKGKYLAGDGQVQETEAADPGGLEASAGAPTDEPTDAPAALEQSHVRVEIGADHFLRQNGRDAISVASEADAQLVKTLLNATGARRRDVEQIQTRLDSALKELAEAKQHRVENDTTAQAQRRFQSTPEYKAKTEKYVRLAELENAGDLPAGTAKDFWDGVNAEFQAFLAGEVGKSREALAEEIAAQEETELGMQFANEAWERASGRVPDFIRNMADYPRWFENAWIAFDGEVERGAYPQLRPGDREGIHTAFARYLAARLISEPAVVEAHRQNGERDREQAAAKVGTEAAARTQRQAAEAERLRKEGADQLRRESAQKRATTPPHPMGNLAGGVRGDRAPAGGEQAPDTTNLTPHELKRQLKRGARTDAARHFGGR